MSAAEIIEQVRALPIADKQELFSFLKEDLENASGEAPSKEISSEEVQEALAEIFDEYDEDFKMLAK